MFNKNLVVLINFFGLIVITKQFVLKDMSRESISKNALSTLISNDLKKRGFKYVGPVIIYSYLQACGMINDHEKDCICYQRIKNTYPCITMDDGLL